MSCCAGPRRGAAPAHVAINDALSMTKSAVRKPRDCTFDRGGLDAVNAHALHAAALSPDDGDVAFGNVEEAGQDVDQLRVRSAFDGRGIEANEKSAVAQSRRPRLAGPRNYANVKNQELTAIGR